MSRRWADWAVIRRNLSLYELMPFDAVRVELSAGPAWLIAKLYVLSLRPEIEPSREPWLLVSELRALAAGGAGALAALLALKRGVPGVQLWPAGPRLRAIK